ATETSMFVDGSQELGHKHVTLRERTMVAVVALVHGRRGAYGVSFPDFPGCIAGGETIDEALHRGRDGLEFHVESMASVGEALPKLHDVAEIRANPDYIEDFVDAVVVSINVDVFGR